MEWPAVELFESRNQITFWPKIARGDEIVAV